MRSSWSFRHIVLSLAGAAVMSFGLIGVLHAQSPRTRILQFSTGESSYLGIRMEDVTASNMAGYNLNSERGVIVQSVEKESPAETAGLQPRDVITEYAGMPVFSSAQFSRLVQETPAGRKVDIGVLRDGKKVALTATVGNREGTDRIERGFQAEPRGEMPDERRGEGRGFMFRLPPNADGFPFSWNGGRGWAEPQERSQERPRLGVAVQPLTDQMAGFLGVPGKSGVVVVSVTDGSAAAGKLRAGDVIVSANGEKVGSPEDLTRLVRRAESTIDLKVVRDKKEISVQVALPSGDSKSGGGSYRL
jgi:serine protease Do